MRTKIFIILLTFFLSANAWSESLGVYGDTWGIDEPDVVNYIKARLSAFQKDGTLDKIKKTAQEKAIHHMEYPDAVSGITPAKKNLTWYIDPTFTEPHDVLDASGKVIIPAGTTFNPLNFGGLKTEYIFIDQRNQSEVDFAKHEMDTHPITRVVLTAGRWIILSNLWHVMVYYDQGGKLTSKLGITHTPSVLTQDGKLLKVTEVKL